MPGPLRRAARARRHARGAAAEAAPPRRARRPSGRRRPGHRGELRLARDGHLEGPRDRVGEAASSAAAGASSSWSATASCRRARTTKGCRRRRTSGWATSGSIVDRNELQSDKPTDEILALGDLEAKLRAFGWHVASCDGHDSRRARVTRSRRCASSDDVPQVLVAHTIKGKGVSFMEHPRALREGGGTYRWHAGAPDDESFERAHARARRAHPERLPARSSSPCRRSRRRAAAPALEGEPESGAGTRAQGHRRVRRRGVRRGAARARRRASDELVVLDADLASDCRVRAVRARVPRPLRRVRDRRAGHGLDGRRARAPRACSRSSTRSRASSPRARTSRSTTRRASARRSIYALPLRRADPGRAGEVAPEPARHLAARGAAEHDDRPAGERGGDAGRCSRWAVEEATGERRDPARDRPLAAADRAARRLPRDPGPRHGAARGHRRDRSSRTGR